VKSSALIFLAAFLALAGSWGGFVLAPQIQLGRNVQTKAVGTGDLYPPARPGLAKQGLEVYRANGCVHCHSQQVGQSGTVCEIVLTDAGTNATAAAFALNKLNPDRATNTAAVLAAGLPKTILTVADMNAAEPVFKALEATGAKADVNILAIGPDIARGWGRRRTVAQDYLSDYPVQPGSRRIGPDLANVGLRLPDANWHLRHLYAPRAEVKGSTMPPHRFLFDMRKAGVRPSPDALPFSAEVAPTGCEIIPKPEARALVAYLLSLRADALLFEAPATPPTASPTVSTNASAMVSPSPSGRGLGRGRVEQQKEISAFTFIAPASSNPEVSSK
jgi:cbb3-type cytochrome oxidase cytochrome c subunit